MPVPSLGSEALNIGFVVETAADIMPREVDISESLFRGALVLLEPTFAWQELEKTSWPLPLPSLGREALNIGFVVETVTGVDISESVFRGVPVLQEPTFAWQELEKTSRPLPVPPLGSEALNIDV